MYLPEASWCKPSATLLVLRHNNSEEVLQPHAGFESPDVHKSQAITKRLEQELLHQWLKEQVSHMTF